MIGINVMPLEKIRTHEFIADDMGSFIHSPNCWCLKEKEEPKDNDGREECFWCGTKTVKKCLLTSSYDECPNCGK